jgi:hypothetical protein
VTLCGQCADDLIADDGELGEKLLWLYRKGLMIPDGSDLRYAMLAAEIRRRVPRAEIGGLCLKHDLSRRAIVLSAAWMAVHQEPRDLFSQPGAPVAPPG